MCGIAGIFHPSGRKADAAAAKRMTRLIAHRGPDGEGVISSGPVALGHRRLAIIDVKRGMQPMYDRTKRYALIFNGEIYNFRELRGTLAAQGSRFRTDSDTEVVIEGFVRHGPSFFSELNGMFALAILDRKTNDITLARDRLGIKPLYIYHPPSRRDRPSDVVLFASEIKAFYGHDEFKPEPYEPAIKEYLTFSNLHHNISFFRHVSQLEPGSWRTYSAAPGSKSVQSGPIWHSRYTQTHASHDDRLSEYRKLFDAAVERHMISDVPVGCYLSGGIDSSSVAVTAAKFRAQRKEGALHVFTGTFPEAGKYAEEHCAAETARSVGAKHHLVTITPALFKNSIEKIAYALDEPRAGMGAFPQYHVSALVHQHVTVVLTGHGGDELFAGYPLYKARLIRSLLRQPGDSLRALFATKPTEFAHILYYLFYPVIQPEVGYGTFVMFSRAQQRSLFTDRFRKQTAGHDAYGFVKRLATDRTLTPEARVQEIYLRTFLPSLFIVEDKVGMAHSIEARTPICDNTLLEFSQRVPLAEKLYAGELKSIPKDAMRDRLLPLLYQQPKKGFPTPLSLWFRGPLRSYIENVLLSDRFAERGIVERSAVQKLLRRHMRKHTDGLRDYVEAARIWSLLQVELWYRIFIDGERRIRNRSRNKAPPLRGSVRRSL